VTRAQLKEIYLVRSYIAKDSGTDDNIGSYWKVGIGRGYYHDFVLSFGQG
jgi:hypothetical protein